MAKFVLSTSKMLEQHALIKGLCDELSFSAKTNYEVAGLMEELTDCSFNLHFLAEVDRINDKDRIWFFPQGWTAEDLHVLFEKGVSKFVVDNENDLGVLLVYLETNDRQADVLLRLKFQERTTHTGKFFVYGMPSATVLRLVRELKKNEHIAKLGIHTHRKSQNISEWGLLYEFQQILDDEILGMIDILDIGGGIPIQYKNFKADVLPHIFDEFKQAREWLRQYDVSLIIEPGRAIAGPAIKLVTTIKNVYENTVVVDASVYNCAIDTFVVHHKLLVEGELDPHKGKSYTIKGYTPCSADIFRYRVYLDGVKQGDEMVFLNAGAYNFASDFCSLPKIPTEVVE